MMADNQDTQMAEAGKSKQLSMKDLAAQIEALQSQLLDQATENAALRDQVATLQPSDGEQDDLFEEVRKLKLELAAVRAQSATADQIVRHSEQILERLDEERRRGGRNHWVIKNKYFKNRNGEPAMHDFFSNAETPREAIEDYKRRTGAQHDASDKRGDPFEAVRADLPEAVATV